METILRLRRFLDAPQARRETCELCGVPIEIHKHVIDLENRRIMCSCRACYLLFTQKGAGKFRSVPERFMRVEGVDFLRDQAPVGVAFFIRNSATNRVTGFYPSPAGATESALEWDEAAAPELASLEPDVEALLVRRDEAWIVPVDACYELVGRIRKSWRGFDGGSEARNEIDAFFEGLRA